MKRLLYNILPACLLAFGLHGCDDETLYNALPEAVPLTMSVNGKAFAMGEHLKVDISVNQDAEGNEVVANEDFDIYFTAKDGNKDVSDVFETFSGIVTFPKGEKQIQVDFPVKKVGLEGHVNLNFVAFARGYKMANSSSVIKVSDYYRITMSLENNNENTVLDGEKFVLVAQIDKPSSEAITIRITPKEGEKDFYSGLPDFLTLPAGTSKVKSDEVTLSSDGTLSKSKELTLNFSSGSKTNPMTNASMAITLKAIDNPDLFDMTKVYELPDRAFVSSKNQSLVQDWFTGDTYEMKDNGTAPHPTATLAAEGWKFDYAVEFHKINQTNYWDANATNMLKCFANANEAAAQKVATVNNAKCTKINDNGEIVLWADAKNGGAKSYAFSAIQTCKVNGGQGSTFLSNFARIYPGMRIEFKVRLRGPRAGFVPTIELKNPDISSNGIPKTITVLKNLSGSMITQSVTGDTGNDIVSKTTALPKASEYNIYWIEMLDNENIEIGINGVTTLTVNKSDLTTWPYDKAAMPLNTKGLGCRGLFLVMRVCPSPDLEAGNMQPGWDNELKQINDSETEGPRMEIDWVRFYKNDIYKMESNEKNNRNTYFY